MPPRHPPQGGDGISIDVTSGDAAEMRGADLASALWSNGITAVADARGGQADDSLKDACDEYGVAYGHIDPADESRVGRLRNAAARYRTLLIAGDIADARGLAAEAGLRTCDHPRNRLLPEEGGAG